MRLPVFKKIIKGWGSLFLIFTFLIASYAPSPVTEKAHAVDAVTVIGGNGTFQEYISAAANTVSAAADKIGSAAEASLAAKEWTFDAIAYELVNIAIKHMSRSIVQWINSGFEGSPAFVTDLQGFLLDIADQEAGAFLTEIGLGFMCSPFKLDVQAALAIQYQRARDYKDQCRLTDVVGNIEKFYAGDFKEGGWGGWLQLTTRPGNNPYGALVTTQQELSIRIRNAQGQEKALLQFGSGFLSYRDCSAVEDSGGAEHDCPVTTPGKVIEDQLNNTLDSGRQRLVMADEINEILSALFSQLVVQAFSGAGGLLGLTSSGYASNGSSYLDAATAATTAGENVGLVNNSQNPIKKSITVEGNYLALQEEIVSLINEAESYEQDAYGSTSCSSRGLTPSLRNARSSALEDVNASSILIARLQGLDAQYENTKNPTIQFEIMEDYLDFQTSGALHTEVDNVQIDFQTIGNPQMGLISEINALKAQIDVDCRNVESRRVIEGSQGGP